MNDATRTFEITLGDHYTVKGWWDRKYPSEPYWKVCSDGNADRALRKYDKGVLRDIRQLLQKSVGTALITNMRLVADTTFSITVMGERDEIDLIDPSKIV